jgi:hypothetical protein
MTQYRVIASEAKQSEAVGGSAGRDRFVACGSQLPQLVSGKVPGAPMPALGANRLRVDIGGEDTEHAIDMRQVGSILIELAL